MNLAVLATAWGPKHGGINAFNIDFTRGLASCLGNRGNVVCCVPYAANADIASAKRSGVSLISLNKRGDHDEFNPDWIAELRLLYAKIDLWVGHDVISGEAAIKGATTSKSKSALIMHMDYESYISIKNNDPTDAQDRYLDQMKMFRKATFLFGVGPLLSDALHTMTRRSVKELVPGFPNVVGDTVRNQVRAVIFGRMGRKDDVIKQGSTAVAAFASAMKAIREHGTGKARHFRGIMKLFGTENSDDDHRLMKLAKSRCGGSAVVLPLRYSEDRGVIFGELSRANIALLPSWHEGFGLTGWEAIAAEAPLILSRNTGLWQLLARTWSIDMAEALVIGVDINGVKQDEGRLANAIVRIADNLEDRVRTSAELKKMMQDKLKCTWNHTAEVFLKRVKFITQKEAEEAQRKRAEAAFVGKWTAFLVEGSMFFDPEVIREDVIISVNKQTRKLEGKSKYKVRDQVREEVFSGMEARDEVLAGTTKTRNWNDGWGRFQIAWHNAENLLEGIVSWSSSLRTAVDWSRYIWVKNGAKNGPLLAYAEKQMALEVKMFKERLAGMKLHGTTPGPRRPPAHRRTRVAPEV